MARGIAAGKGTSLADRLFASTWNRAPRSSFGSTPRAGCCHRRAHPRSRRARDAPRRRGAEPGRATVDGDRPQALAQGRERSAIPPTRSAPGAPSISGTVRGLGRDHPLQMRHERRKALRESGLRVVLAGVPATSASTTAKHVKRQATLIAANRSAKDARLNRRPSIEAIGDASTFLEQLAERPGAGKPREGLARPCGARPGARKGIDAQAKGAGSSGEHVNPVAFFGPSIARPAIRRSSSRTAATSWPPLPTSCAPALPLTWLDPGVFGRSAWVRLRDGAASRDRGRRCGCSGDGLRLRPRRSSIAFVPRHSLHRGGGERRGWTQIAREQVKMLHDDVGTCSPAPRITRSRGLRGGRVSKSGARPKSRTPASGRASWPPADARCS